MQGTKSRGNPAFQAITQKLANIIPAVLNPCKERNLDIKRSKKLHIQIAKAIG